MFPYNGQKMNMKRFIWILVITTFTLGFLGFRYADKMCREYLDTPLSVDVIKQQLFNMTDGANLPKGEWSYGIDISHHLIFSDQERMASVAVH